MSNPPDGHSAEDFNAIQTQYLVDEVAQCLDNPEPDAVEEELAELGLIRYVKDFMPPDWRTNGLLRDHDRRDG